MGAQESIGTTLAASAAVPATHTSTDFAGLSWTAVGEVTEIPEFGGQAATIEHTPLADGITRKIHGAINYGSLNVPMALDKADAGQNIVDAAFTSKDQISFRVTYPDGAIDYFSGKCMSNVKRGANVGNVLGGSAMIEIDTSIVVVAAP